MILPKKKISAQTSSASTTTVFGSNSGWMNWSSSNAADNILVTATNNFLLQAYMNITVKWRTTNNQGYIYTHTSNTSGPTAQQGGTIGQWNTTNITKNNYFAFSHVGSITYQLYIYPNGGSINNSYSNIYYGENNNIYQSDSTLIQVTGTLVAQDWSSDNWYSLGGNELVQLQSFNQYPFLYTDYTSSNKSKCIFL